MAATQQGTGEENNRNGIGMIPKELNDIRSDDLDLLIENGVSEGQSIDYKRDAYGRADDDKKELLADVSSFANTVGGDLIIGVEEEGGLPVRITGLNVPDRDEERQRLENVLRSGIDPRMPFRIQEVEHSSGAFVFVIRVDRSWRAPHRVIYKGVDRFYARNSAGKYPMDVGELRDSFLRATTLIERIEAFRINRLADIKSGLTPVPLQRSPLVCLHLVPLQSFATSVTFDLAGYYANPSLLQPMNHSGWAHRPTFKGLATYTEIGPNLVTYAELYRNGIIEAVSGYLIGGVKGDGTSLPGVYYEEVLIGAVRMYLKVQEALGVQPPIYVFFSLLGVRGCTMAVGDRYFSTEARAIAEDDLPFPEILISDFSADIGRAMKPVFDIVWNACGHARSYNYDASGAWAPRTGY